MLVLLQKLSSSDDAGNDGDHEENFSDDNREKTWFVKHPVFIDVGGQVADERNGKTQTQKKKRESETFHALIVTRICFLLVKNRLRKSKTRPNADSVLFFQVKFIRL